MADKAEDQPPKMTIAEAEVEFGIDRLEVDMDAAARHVAQEELEAGMPPPPRWPEYSLKAAEHHPTHRWSGWPGAWCMDCGIGDPLEVAIIDARFDPWTGEWEGDVVPPEYVVPACTEPGSKRHDPYERRAREREGGSGDAG